MKDGHLIRLNASSRWNLNSSRTAATNISRMIRSCSARTWLSSLSSGIIVCPVREQPCHREDSGHYPDERKHKDYHCVKFGHCYSCASRWSHRSTSEDRHRREGDIGGGRSRSSALLDGTRRGSDGWNWNQLCILRNHELFIVKVSCGAKKRSTSANCKVQVWAVTLFGTES